MAAPKGNKYWQMRDKHGRGYAYSPEELWNEAIKYFEWVEKNPLIEQKPFVFQGKVIMAKVKKMRAMTIGGFCLFADINKDTFFTYRNNKDFSDVVIQIEEIIKEQKFTGAAADLLNANIIARDLALRDESIINHQNNGGSFEPTVISFKKYNE